MPPSCLCVLTHDEALKWMLYTLQKLHNFKPTHSILPLRFYGGDTQEAEAEEVFMFTDAVSFGANPFNIDDDDDNNPLLLMLLLQ